MFRESDEVKKAKHPTFLNKPRPTLQLISEASRNDYSTTAQSYSPRSDGSMPAPVPTTWDTAYDPKHKDADWTGLVSLKNNQKRHSQEHRSQQLGIEATENGIISKDEKKEWPHRRPVDTNVIDPSHVQGSFVLGGIDDPEERYKSVAMRQQMYEATGRDQLILEKRQKPITKIGDPVSRAAKDRQMHDMRGSGDGERNRENLSLCGVSKRPQAYSTKSFVADLGSKLIDSVPERPRRDHAADNAGNTRDLISANYNPFPGYTGKKSHY